MNARPELVQVEPDFLNMVIFGRNTKYNIIKALMMFPNLIVSDLIFVTRSNGGILRKHLDTFLEQDMVKEIPGKAKNPTRYHLNEDHEIIATIMRLINQYVPDVKTHSKRI